MNHPTHRFPTVVPSARVLVIVAHPSLHLSRANRLLLKTARGVAGVTTHDLYAAYPDLHIDVAREKALLLAHDAIVWQFPMYWYSSPAILKEWQDLVLELGWAYGRGGDALRGKRLMVAITTGGPQAAYADANPARASLDQLLLPFSQTAALCGMQWVAPLALHGATSASEPTLHAHARGYADALAALRDASPPARS